MFEIRGRNIEDLSLAHEVEIDRHRGKAILRIPVPVPPGRAGFAPALSLVYTSGAGNSIFGAGWALDWLPAIGIDTSEHVPRWDGSDGFVFGEAALVPWLARVGSEWQPRGELSAEWSIAYHRLREGGSQLRVERCVHRSTGRVHFRTRDAANVLTVFGARSSGEARVAGGDALSQTFQWLPELRIDATGNAMCFEYVAENHEGIDPDAAFERRSRSLAQRYLKRIRYGNVSPLQLDEAALEGRLPDVRWCFQVVFDYGDHADAQRPAAEPDRSWPARSDAFSSHRAGFELRTRRLCRRILSFHEFDELGPGPTLVGSMLLRHEDNPAGATLREIEWRGHRREGEEYHSRAVPALRLSYSLAGVADALLTAPAETLENLPAGFSGSRLSVVDLLGDGLPGILSESDRSWFYKPNLGGGRFGPQILIGDRPAIGTGTHAFADVDGDGDTDLAQLAGRMAGRFAHDRQQRRWQPYRAIPAMAHVEALGGRADWVDVNGDGLPDIVVAHADRLVWFASQDEGFAAPIEVPLPASARSAPAVTQDRALDLFFADMDGDGLVDLVRVENGRVEYWPSLGNGRFGEGIVLEGSPRFAPEGEFDAERVRWVDLDGSGTTDLVYLGRGEVTVWHNASGNRLVPGPRLRGLPYFDNVSSVQVLDLLGNGQPCLVWSSPLPGSSALSYLPLAPREPPRLLLAVEDGLGLETRLQYSSSASHYLRDLAAGRGWSVLLPSHSPVVERRVVLDQIGRTLRVERFEYHDGFFDGQRRSLQGFAQVDVYDAEAADGDLPGPGAAAFSPPLLERTWFLVGAAPWYPYSAQDTYRGAGELASLAAYTFDDSDLSAQEAEDALRVMFGSTLRRERYALDERGHRASHPFDVVQTTWRVRRTQPAWRGAGATFVALPVDTWSAVYEQSADEPRITHQIVLETDDFDRVISEVDIAYPRRGAWDVAAQGRLEVLITENEYVHLDEPSRFQLGVPVATRAAELKGVEATGRAPLSRARLRAPDVVAALAAAGAHQIEPEPGVVAARRLQWEQSFYWDDRRAAALPHGQVAVPALLHHEEAACFTTEFITEVFASRVDEERLRSLGYLQRAGLWWQRDDIQHPGPAGTFLQRVRVETSEGGVTGFQYDRYAIGLTAHTDAVGNHTRAELDYHSLSPARVVDPNGNVEQGAYDPLGVVVRTSTQGHVGAQPWGFDPLPEKSAGLPESVAEALARPQSFLARAASAVAYDLDAWRRAALPTLSVALAAESLRHDGRGGGGEGRIQVALSYFDGRGQLLQQKTLVEPGLAIQRTDGPAGGDGIVVDAAGQPALALAEERWQVSGHVLRNAKEQPIRQYQPYFSPDATYETDALLRKLGASTLTLYDALGRQVGQEFPDGSFSRTSYGPWAIESADANDTVLGSPYQVMREALADSDPERQALEHAKRHANTPASEYLDARGRAVATRHRGGSGPDRRTEMWLDAAGDPIEIIDPRGLVAYRHRRDMQGRLLLTQSIDTGNVATLPDALDRARLGFDARGLEIESAYDLLGRLTTTHVRGLGLDHRVEERRYGEREPDAGVRNLRGNLASLRDSAGLMLVEQCDPAAEVVASTLRLRSASTGEPDWRGQVELDDEAFRSDAERDALGRTIRARLPDGTERRFEYLLGGGLATLRLSSVDGRLRDVSIFSGAEYDAAGSQTALRLGNGVEIAYEYDADTSRLSRQRAQRLGRIYQDLRYTFDPVGNLVRLDDRAHDGPGALLPGTARRALRQYTYDAHYRLESATGRVHQALLQSDYAPGASGTVHGTRHLSLDNGAAVESYTRHYAYDPSGNLRRIEHRGESRRWSTALWISDRSNRSLPELDDNGIPISDPESRFDATGNTRSLAHLRRMDWNWQGALARAVLIERPNGTDDDEAYLYGAGRVRVRKLATRVVDGGQLETTETLYFGDCERLRIRRGGRIILDRWVSHLDAGGDRVAVAYRWVTDELARETDDVSLPRLHYQLSTHQGSAAVELDEAGGLISYEEYFPYGGSAFIAGDRMRDVQRRTHRYMGKERDSATGLYCYGQRYYAPWMGRWLSPDPSGPEDDLNLYQFVLGDPVGNTDQNGLQSRRFEACQRGAGACHDSRAAPQGPQFRLTAQQTEELFGKPRDPPSPAPLAPGPELTEEFNLPAPEEIVDVPPVTPTPRSARRLTGPQPILPAERGEPTAPRDTAFDPAPSSPAVPTPQTPASTGEPAPPLLPAEAQEERAALRPSVERAPAPSLESDTGTDEQSTARIPWHLVHPPRTEPLPYERSQPGERRTAPVDPFYFDLRSPVSSFLDYSRRLTDQVQEWQARPSPSLLRAAIRFPIATVVGALNPFALPASVQRFREAHDEARVLRGFADAAAARAEQLTDSQPQLAARARAQARELDVKAFQTSSAAADELALNLVFRFLGGAATKTRSYRRRARAERERRLGQIDAHLVYGPLNRSDLGFGDVRVRDAARLLENLYRALPAAAQVRGTGGIIVSSRGTFFTFGARDLTARQIARLPRGLGVRGGVRPHLHAEPTALRAVFEQGGFPAILVATRNFCPNCIARIRNAGGIITGPRSAVFPNPGITPRTLTRRGGDPLVGQ